ncbi:Ig-like domain-containing protein [Geodermatophilus ruber]|uniref:Ig-like domain (Group 3) n=1 Tax=Geodermatophilus ruber TaxID=504800 RepID=A0A1I4KYK2_9ACTN|nr:Ig-like domain-containing protein [Geodermatophilus ruber]SFL83477.1 Ig-like domain (group 3) [Geodermatophilus ruber]
MSDVRRSWCGALRALHVRLLVLPVLLALLVAVGAMLGSAAFVGLLGLSPSLRQSGSAWLGLGLPALASTALVLGGLSGLVLGAGVVHAAPSGLLRALVRTVRRAPVLLLTVAAAGAGVLALVLLAPVLVVVALLATALPRRGPLVRLPRRRTTALLALPFAPAVMLALRWSRALLEALGKGGPRSALRRSSAAVTAEPRTAAARLVAAVVAAVAGGWLLSETASAVVDAAGGTAGAVALADVLGVAVALVAGLLLLGTIPADDAAGPSHPGSRRPWRPRPAVAGVVVLAVAASVVLPIGGTPRASAAEPVAVVDSAADDLPVDGSCPTGACTLRRAVAVAEAARGGAVRFDRDLTIELAKPVVASVPLVLDARGHEVVLQGAGGRLLELGGQGEDPWQLIGLVLRGGRAPTGAGGGAVLASRPGVVVDSTFIGNRADGPGGAVLSESKLVAVGTTFSADASGSGAAHVQALSLDVLLSTAVDGRGTTAFESIDGMGAVQYSIVAPATGSAYEGVSNAAFALRTVEGSAGNPNVVVEREDLGLTALGDHGGTVPTYALLPTSDAIDFNRDERPWLEFPVQDARGAVRVMGARIDPGAVEFDPGTATTLTVGGVDADSWSSSAGAPVAVGVAVRTTTDGYAADGKVALQVLGSQGVVASTDQQLTDGNATWQPDLPEGTYTLNAFYEPSGDLMSSQDTGTLVVGRAPDRLLVSVPETVDTGVPYDVTVSLADSGAALTGPVTARDGSSTATADFAGKASVVLQLRADTPGPRTVEVSWAGDAVHPAGGSGSASTTAFDPSRLELTREGDQLRVRVVVGGSGASPVGTLTSSAGRTLPVGPDGTVVHPLGADVDAGAQRLVLEYSGNASVRAASSYYDYVVGSTEPVLEAATTGQGGTAYGAPVAVSGTVRSSAGVPLGGTVRVTGPGADATVVVAPDGGWTVPVSGPLHVGEHRYAVGFEPAEAGRVSRASMTIRHVVDKAPVTLAVSVPARIEHGAPLQVGLALGDTPAGSWTAEAVVVVDGVDHRTVLIGSDGTATASLTDLDVGRHTVTARLVSPVLAAATVADQAVEVTPAATTLSVTSFGPTTGVVPGQRLSLQAQVVSATGDAVAGAVQVVDDGVVVATSALAGGVASLEFPAGAPGLRQLQVRYLGDRLHLPSAGAAQVRVLTPASVQVTDARTPYGQDVDVRVTVAGDVPGGLVELAASGPALAVPRPLGSAPLVDGVAVVRVSQAWSLPVGDYVLTATYTGDAGNARSTATGTLVVEPAASTVELAAEPSPVEGPVRVRVAVRAPLPIGGTASWRLIRSESTPGTAYASGTATLGPGGVAYLALALAPGRSELEVTWSGQADVAGSTASLVLEAGRLPVSLSAPATSAYGEGVRLVASVPTQPFGYPPGATVGFSVDGALAATVPLGADGRAVATLLTDLEPGVHTLTAVYDDGPGAAPRTSAPVLLTVLPAESSPVVASTGPQTSAGNSAFSVRAAVPGTATCTGTGVATPAVLRTGPDGAQGVLRWLRPGGALIACAFVPDDTTRYRGATDTLYVDVARAQPVLRAVTTQASTGLRTTFAFTAEPAADNAGNPLDLPIVVRGADGRELCRTHVSTGRCELDIASAPPGDLRLTLQADGTPWFADAAEEVVLRLLPGERPLQVALRPVGGSAVSGGAVLVEIGVAQAARNQLGRLAVTLTDASGRSREVCAGQWADLPGSDTLGGGQVARCTLVPGEGGPDRLAAESGRLAVAVTRSGGAFTDAVAAVPLDVTGCVPIPEDPADRRWFLFVTGTRCGGPDHGTPPGVVLGSTVELQVGLGVVDGVRQGLLGWTDGAAAERTRSLVVQATGLPRPVVDVLCGTVEVVVDGPFEVDVTSSANASCAAAPQRTPLPAGGGHRLVVQRPLYEFVTVAVRGPGADRAEVEAIGLAPSSRYFLSDRLVLRAASSRCSHPEVTVTGLTDTARAGLADDRLSVRNLTEPDCTDILGKPGFRPGSVLRFAAPDGPYALGFRSVGGFPTHRAVRLAEDPARRLSYTVGELGLPIEVLLADCRRVELTVRAFRPTDVLGRTPSVPRVDIRSDYARDTACGLLGPEWFERGSTVQGTVPLEGFSAVLWPYGRVPASARFGQVVEVVADDLEPAVEGVLVPAGCYRLPQAVAHEPGLGELRVGLITPQGLCPSGWAPFNDNGVDPAVTPTLAVSSTAPADWLVGWTVAHPSDARGTFAASGHEAALTWANRDVQPVAHRCYAVDLVVAIEDSDGTVETVRGPAADAYFRDPAHRECAYSSALYDSTQPLLWAPRSGGYLSFARWELKGGGTDVEGNGLRVVPGGTTSTVPQVVAVFDRVCHTLTVNGDTPIYVNPAPNCGHDDAGMPRYRPNTAVMLSAPERDGHTRVGWEINGKQTWETGDITISMDSPQTAIYHYQERSEGFMETVLGVLEEVAVRAVGAVAAVVTGYVNYKVLGKLRLAITALQYVNEGLGHLGVDAGPWEDYLRYAQETIDYGMAGLECLMDTSDSSGTVRSLRDVAVAGVNAADAASAAYGGGDRFVAGVRLGGAGYGIGSGGVTIGGQAGSVGSERESFGDGSELTACIGGRAPSYMK